MRDKLIQVIRQAEEEFTGLIMHGKFDNPDDIPSREAMIADKLIEDRWVRPPVKIGQELWDIHYNRPRKWEVVYLGYNGKEWFINVHWWKDRHNFRTMQITYPFLGKMWYFTKEEAEQALRKEDEGK